MVLRSAGNKTSTEEYIMSYKFSGSQNKSPVQTKTTPVKKEMEKKQALYRTGLFAPKDAEKAALFGEVASVGVKEDIHIPAGSFISIRQPREGTSEKVVLNLVINEGMKK